MTGAGPDLCAPDDVPAKPSASTLSMSRVAGQATVSSATAALWGAWSSTPRTAATARSASRSLVRQLITDTRIARAVPGRAAEPRFAGCLNLLDHVVCATIVVAVGGQEAHEALGDLRLDEQFGAG